MKVFFITMSFLCIALSTVANNVVISNISIVGGQGNFRVQFDLSWDNGWRIATGPNNYDGVWVFFKFRTGSGSDWQPLTMNGIGNSIPATYTAYQTSGAIKTGAVIHRSIFLGGTGTSTLTDLELGLTDLTAFGIDIRGYAIEMVYIPPCTNCIIGDGNGVGESTNSLHVADNTSGALGSLFRVDVNGLDDATLEAGININAAGITGNALFATGQAMWCMKYEITQGAYCDFLNSLTLPQQTTRTALPPTSDFYSYAMAANANLSGNFIQILTPSIGGVPAEYSCHVSLVPMDERTCNLLSWPDLAAYLDWSGLAPMTEICFERICRGATTIGPVPSVLFEKAWGSASIFAQQYVMSSSGPAQYASNASTTSGNADYNITAPYSGPLRNGVFADGSSNRVTSGSTLYGVMEMSGNIYEPCVTVRNVAGRAFTSLNGDGTLSLDGNANTPDWPCGNVTSAVPSCSEVTGAAGIITKGGSFLDDASKLSVSDRTFGSSALRFSNGGGRGVLYIQ